MESDWSWYYCNQPPVEFDTNANHRNEVRSNSVWLEGDSDPYCSISEPTRIKGYDSRSFAMDARMRLDHLKSGCNSSLPCCALDRLLYNFNRQRDVWDSGLKEEESALDLVELLDIEKDIQDEESWLYESPKKQGFAEKHESALKWCRHVLDNPTPEMEAACRGLINRLDQRSNSHFYRCPAVFHRANNAAVASSMDKTSVNTTQNVSDSLDNNQLSISHDSLTTKYKLQDITDVHIMARIQEASLRQDYVATPMAVSESKPDLLSPISSPCQSPTSVAEQGCQSPKLARLRQQVTQFKLLKLAQSRGRTQSPLRTSLRSLQAVRNSRSLETDDCHPDDQITYPPSGITSTRMLSGCWSPSVSAASVDSSGLSHSVRDSPVRTTAIKRLQKSQSLSPCRIPHPAKGYLSVHARVFASPERSTTVAWARNPPSAQW